MAKKTSRKKAQRKNAGKRSSPKPEKKVVALDLKQLEVVVDPALRLAWTDRMTISTRADVPVATLSFYAVAMNKLCEAARIQTSIPHLRQMVDVICRSIDYYPKKPPK